MKTHPPCFILLVWICCWPLVKASAQTELAGTWSGYITQEPAGLAAKYMFQTDFSWEGNALTGESLIRMEDDPEIFGRIQLSGAMEGSEIHFLETEMLSQRMYSFAWWCLKDCRLTVMHRAGKTVLEGRWTSDMCGGSGFIHLERPDPS